MFIEILDQCCTPGDVNSIPGYDFQVICKIAQPALEEFSPNI